MTARSQAEDVAVVLAAAESKRALRPATDPTNLAGLVVDRRSCGVCGYTPCPDERVVGACVPGYHDLKLVAMHRAPVVSKAAREAEVNVMNYGIVRDHLGRHVAGGAE